MKTFGFKGGAGPKVPATGSDHQQHPVKRNAHGHVLVRHPSVVGPNMMAPQPDHSELPSGTLSTNAPGGIIGGLDPFQRAKSVQNSDFSTQ